MSAATRTERLVGQAVPRVEDGRLLAGRGRFLDDIRIPGLLHAAFVRSPYAHARIVGVDATAALGIEGLEAAFTGSDIAAATAPLRIDAEIPGYLRPVFHPLATDRVRHVGDPVAIVVARSRAAAEDAAEAVAVEYDPLPAPATVEAAADAPPLFDDIESNVLYREQATDGDVDAAFAAADHVVRATFEQQRVTNVPMEGRGGIADFDATSGDLTYYASTQTPHGARLILAAALAQPVSRVRVVAPDVGGGFGQKIPTHREEIALCAAARLLGKPVKWSEDRAENLVAGGHAREETVEAELALRADGTILGLRARMRLDHGAYPVLPIPAPAYIGAVRLPLPGAYRIPALAFEGEVVATCKASYVPYRGPWAVECLVREGLLDLAARELGLDPLELRRRNLIPPEEQPAPLATGTTLEGVRALEALERAAELVGEEDRPVGFALLVEPAPGPPDYTEAAGFGRLAEPARARLEPDGRVTLFTGQSPHGQGHVTTLAQLVADELGIPLDQVTVEHGDTQTAPFHPLGTGGSRAATMASGAAVEAARRLREQVHAVASSLFGTDRDEPALAEVAAAAYLGGRADALEAVAQYRQPGGGWSVAAHACVVDVDRATGIVRVVRYVVVEDCGRMVNPAVVDGQIRGGVVQGIGAALLEHAAYDEDGQFLTGTFMDYLVPTATDVPRIEIEHLPEQPLHELDFRGVGEGGAIAAPAAVANAVAAATGMPMTRLPITPERVLELLAP